MTVEQAQVFGAEAWEKAGKGQELTLAESKSVLRTLGNQMFGKDAQRAPATDRELIAA